MEELKSFSPSLRFFIELTGSIKTGVILQYFFIVILTIIVYRLGFAKKLPLLKNIVIYTCLIIGCLLLLVFSYGLPIAEGLGVAAIILIAYKIRLHQSKRQQSEAK
ncbi:putative membrane protein ylaH [Neobacillus massiliamazoniensis]|uniref:Putative membrane protein ylaH n=1 Tax=Neobacillus massiliamazoniensis TaxID=1499688 RepID=A0A0U1NRG0_9BACI|nr:YlaH-like family protein [Neobacillus massiliamazoniensis]CRK80631.1 putative membrane protein ylaH [Neobacillus massiliamazoniensis]